MSDNAKQIYNYTVILEKESDGGYHAFCPVLKGCHSQGDTFEETIANITEAIELYLESLIADEQPIPKEDLIFKPLNILKRVLDGGIKPLNKVSADNLTFLTG
jgi:predicted RNase H-like HicB family nuclease